MERRTTKNLLERNLDEMKAVRHSAMRVLLTRKGRRANMQTAGKWNCVQGIRTAASDRACCFANEVKFQSKQDSRLPSLDSFTKIQSPSLLEHTHPLCTYTYTGIHLGTVRRNQTQIHLFISAHSNIHIILFFLFFFLNQQATNRALKEANTKPCLLRSCFVLYFFSPSGPLRSSVPSSLQSLIKSSANETVFFSSH